MGTFIFYDKVLSSDNRDIQQENDNKNQGDLDINYNDEEKEENSIEQSKLKEIPEGTLENILSKLEVYNQKFSNSYPISDFKSFSNNMSNQDKLNFLVSNISNHSFGEKFNKNDLVGVSSKYFNDDFKFDDESLSCFVDGCETLINYNKQTGVYTYNENHPGHGGESYYRDTIHFIDGFYDEVSKEYIINTQILYGDICDVCGPLQEVYDSNSRDNVVYDYVKEGADGIDMDDAYESSKDKLPITVFKFVKNSSDEIVLKSVTIEK